MIYILRTKDNEPSYIKVGYAKKDIAQRITTLQIGCPLKLELIFAKNGSIKDEKAIHRKLKEFHVTGEWFKWNRETSAILKIPLNAPVVSAVFPGFLTPRQKQINSIFRPTKNTYESPMPVDTFLASHKYSFQELLDIPNEKASFILAMITCDEAVSVYGHAKGGSMDPSHKELYVVPKESFDMRNRFTREPVLSTQ